MRLLLEFGPVTALFVCLLSVAVALLIAKIKLVHYSNDRVQAENCLWCREALQGDWREQNFSAIRYATVDVLKGILTRAWDKITVNQCLTIVNKIRKCCVYVLIPKVTIFSVSWDYKRILLLEEKKCFIVEAVTLWYSGMMVLNTKYTLCLISLIISHVKASL